MPNLTIAEKKFLQAVQGDDLKTVQQMMGEADYILRLSVALRPSYELIKPPIKHNNVKMLRYLLTTSPDFGLSADASSSLLEYSVKYASLEINKTLMPSLNVHINETNALALAAERGNSEILQLLIDRGGDIEVKDMYGRTPLQLALEKGSVGGITFLIEHGANININETTTRTPFKKRLDEFLKVHNIVMGNNNSPATQDRITKLEKEVSSLKVQLADALEQLKNLQNQPPVESNQRRSIFR